jgi:hypothetical protein
VIQQEASTTKIDHEDDRHLSHDPKYCRIAVIVNGLVNSPLLKSDRKLTNGDGTSNVQKTFGISVVKKDVRKL